MISEFEIILYAVVVILHMATLTTIEGIDGAGKTTAQNALKEVATAPVLTTEPNDSEGYDPEWNTTDWFGEKVREAISTSESDDLSVFLLFLADHAHHYATTVAPALEAGHDVLCDRYIGSRYAYQSLALEDRIKGDPIEYLMLVQEQSHDIDTSNPNTKQILQTAENLIPDELYDESPLMTRYAFGLAQHSELYPELLTHPTEDFPGLTVLDEPAEWSKLPDHTILLDLPVDVSIERMGQEGDEVFENRPFLEKVRERYLEVAERNPDRFTIVDATQSKQAVQKEVKSVLK